MRNSEGGRNRARFRDFLHGLTWEEEGEEKARGALVMSFFIHLHPHWCCDDWGHCSESKLLEWWWWWWCWWVCTSSPAAATEEALVTHNASIANPSPPCLAQWTRKNQTPPPAADLWTQNRQKAPKKSMELEDQGQNLKFLATPATTFCIFLLSRVWILQQCHAGFTLVGRTKGRDRRMTRGSMLRDGTNGQDRWMTSSRSRLRDGTNGQDRWMTSSRSRLRDGTNERDRWMTSSRSRLRDGTNERDRWMTSSRSRLRDGTNGRDRWMTSNNRLRDGTNGQDQWIESSSSLRDGTNG